MHAIAWPFIAAEALEAGTLTFRELRRFHEAAYPGVWAPRGVELSPVRRARAAWLWSRRRGVVAGLSASALHGARWVEAEKPAELLHDNRRPPPLIIVRGGQQQMREVVLGDGYASQNSLRLYFGLGGEKAEGSAPPIIDEVIVKWPRSGSVQRFKAVPSNQIIAIEEGRDAFETKAYGSKE